MHAHIDLSHDTIDDVLCDPELLGAALGDPATWQMWRIVLKAGFGIVLNRDEARAFATIAGGRKPPTKRCRELWAIVGRKGGKSRMAAAIAVYAACFIKHKLVPGQRGRVAIISMSLDQAKEVLSYALGFLEKSDMLRKQIASTTATEIRLKNGILITTSANSFRSSRGYFLICAVFDEVAFWSDDATGAIPDVAVYTAVLPNLMPTNGMLIGISSAYRKSGLLYTKYRDFFGKDSDDTLVVKGTTTDFNQSIDENWIAAYRAADPSGASAEWDSSFRVDLEGFLDDAVIDRSINYARPLELPWRPNFIYRAHTDPSGGAIAGDAYSIAIGHREGEKYIIDVVRGRFGPFDPVQLTGEFADLCKQYRIREIVGDGYSKEWCQSAWRSFGFHYTRSEETASDSLFGRPTDVQPGRGRNP